MLNVCAYLGANLLVQSEVNFLGRLSHPNLVKLLGYCWEDRELLLIYEFMQKGSLERHLYGSKSLKHNWILLLSICAGNVLWMWICDSNIKVHLVHLTHLLFMQGGQLFSHFRGIYGLRLQLEQLRAWHFCTHLICKLFIEVLKPPIYCWMG